ncbi:hypothetical protein BDN72DRAFT_490275 [Pluteus cervinus]|uniref:Uncharacterized protein n=1 Tax=Pluteus cervinus TaxID=181527 RepID=A0ACD3A5J4_9AGAR|nr:hypothetical protein BDN72DRAFT_490275 [Pluteus cervinus]
MSSVSTISSGYIPIVTAGVVEVFLYGIYIPLFALCVYLMSRRQEQTRLWALLIPTVVMFFLATADVAITLEILLAHTDLILTTEQLTSEVLDLAFPKNMLFTVNNFVADSLLMYRCYAIWGFNKYIIIPPAVTGISGTVFSFIVQSSPLTSPLRRYILVYGWCIVVTNVYLTAVTAGKIWWATRRSRFVLEARQVKRYNLIITAIIESGAIYSGCVLITLVATIGNYSIIPNAIYSKMVCITPALIVVQLGLDNAFRTPSQLEASDRPAFPTIPATSTRSVVLDTLSLGLSARSFTSQGEFPQEDAVLPPVDSGA